MAEIKSGLWLGLSSSSPRIAVALVDFAGEEPLWERFGEANHQASAVLAQLTQDAFAETAQWGKAIAGVLVDIGPGSHTGTRVGVAFAKGIAFGQGWPVGLIEAFDLISARHIVLISSRKGEFVVRVPGEAALVQSSRPSEAVGWDREANRPQYPTFADFRIWMDHVKVVDPSGAIPAYYGEPIVSIPKDRSILEVE